MNNKNLHIKKEAIRFARKLEYLLDNCGDIEFINELTYAVSCNADLDDLESIIDEMIAEEGSYDEEDLYEND